MGIDLSGKVVIVTGGAKGIGEGCVQKFLDSNATVVSFDLDNSALATQKSKYASLDSRFSSNVVDVSNEAQVEDAVTKVLAAHGRIDGLINCAGIQTYGSVTDTTEEIWDRTFNVNVKSMFLTAKHVAPTMISQKTGSIVNISSVQSLMSQKTVVAYAASKGAINALTRASAIDLAISNVRVNAILPGSVDTPMLRTSADMHRGEKSIEEVLSDWGAGHPLGRIAKSSEIGDLAVFLVSNESAFITGQSIVIDGGLSIQVPVILPGK
ncbi:FabG Dehydrogenases with different specificities (related to short-chain alcohol dehydrogenases) [actinobacterium SCGC AAA044-D11]